MTVEAELAALRAEVERLTRHARIGSAVERLVATDGWISIVGAEPEWECGWRVRFKGSRVLIERDTLDAALAAAVAQIGEGL